MATSLRIATMEEAKLFWEWANDPQVRQNGFFPEPIPWESHLRWFESKCNEQNAGLFSIQSEGTPAGQLRLDYDPASLTCELGISVGKEFRGKGLSVPALALARMEVQRRWPDAVQIIAKVRSANQASWMSFRKAGYQFEAVEKVKGQDCYRLVDWLHPELSLTREIDRKADFRFRCNAGSKTGMGHAMRCLSVAKALRKLGWQDVSFYLNSEPGSPVEWIRESGFACHVLANADGTQRETQEMLQHCGPHENGVVIFDAYINKEEALLGWKGIGYRRAVFNDLWEPADSSAELQINAGVLAPRGMPAFSGDHCVLLGPRFAALNVDLLALRKEDRSFSRPNPRIVVSLGGSDPKDVSAQLLRYFQEFPAEFWKHANLDLVLGPGYAGQAEDLVDKAADPGQRISIVRSPRSLGEMFLRSDLGILAGGTTGYEACYFGLPFLTVELAENQRLSAEGLAQGGVAPCLGKAEQLTQRPFQAAVLETLHDPEKRRRQSEAGQGLVDGLGAFRIARALASL